MARAKNSAVGSVEVKAVCGDKKCENAGKPLPLSEFPINRNRKNGHHLYCKSCCQRKVKAYRAERKIYPSGIKRDDEPAETLVIFRPKPPSPLEKVRAAIAKGFNQRDTITAETELPVEVVGDCLAELYTELLVERNGTDRKFYLRSGVTYGKSERSLVAV